MSYRIGRDEVPVTLATERGMVAALEGARFRLDAVSLTFSESVPGGGARPHRHHYQEVFIVAEGRVAFTIGEATVEAAAGDVVVVPGDTDHAFANIGDGPLRLIGIHGSPTRPRGGDRCRRRMRNGKRRPCAGGMTWRRSGRTVRWCRSSSPPSSAPRPAGASSTRGAARGRRVSSSSSKATASTGSISRRR